MLMYLTKEYLLLIQVSHLDNHNIIVYKKTALKQSFFMHSLYALFG